jgi:hypothetical protein
LNSFQESGKTTDFDRSINSFEFVFKVKVAANLVSYLKFPDSPNLMFHHGHETLTVNATIIKHSDNSSVKNKYCSSNFRDTYRCLKIREFRIQSVVGKDPVELEKYLDKKIRSS